MHCNVYDAILEDVLRKTHAHIVDDLNDSFIVMINFLHPPIVKTKFQVKTIK